MEYPPTLTGEKIWPSRGISVRVAQVQLEVKNAEVEKPHGRENSPSRGTSVSAAQLLVKESKVASIEKKKYNFKHHIRSQRYHVQ